MEEGRRNLLVGIFVLLGLSAAGTLIVLFGRAPTWLVRGDTYAISVHFDEAGGIRPGTLVTLKGIEIGRVDRVELFAQPGQVLTEETHAVVVLAIDRRYRIPKGSYAVTSEPVLGQGRPPIEIKPPPSVDAALEPGDSIRGTVRRALDTLFPERVVTTFESTASQIRDTARALTPVLDEMLELLGKRPPAEVDRPGGPPGNLSTAVARLDATLRHFNEVLGDGQVKSQLRQTVANVHDMSQRGKQVMAELESASAQAREVMADAQIMIARADQTLTTVDSRLTEVAQAATGTLERADRFLDHFVSVGQQITRGEGNIGRMVMDSKLYDAMVLTAERLALAAEEFRALIAQWREGKIRVAL